MQNSKTKDRISVSLLLLLTLIFVCYNPGDAMADLLGCLEDESKQGIFKVIACKITTTLFDIRKIVYTLGGFGLIAFTFAAIFNKISFKHLANIALSLFLLSMITPFIEYFTSEDGSTPLTYGYFLQPDFTEDDYSMTFGECEGDECPTSTTLTGSGMDENGMPVGEDGMERPRIEKIDSSNIQGKATTEKGGLAGLDQLRNSMGDVDTRTGWQKFKDTIKTVAEEGLKAYNTANSVIAAAGTVYNAVDSTVKGFEGAQGIGGILTAGVGAFNNLGSATGALTSAAGTFGTNYTDKEGQPGLGERVGDFFSGINDAANEGKGVVEDLGTINGIGNGIMDIPGNLGNIF